MGMGVMKEIKVYLGYKCVSPKVNSGGLDDFAIIYTDYAVCYGSTPEEVMRSYFDQYQTHKFVKENMVVKNENNFYYHDYFDINFMKLPTESTLEADLMKMH
jgi:hypothetical protein